MCRSIKAEKGRNFKVRVNKRLVPRITPQPPPDPEADLFLHRKGDII